jgi:hypothetical protein
METVILAYMDIVKAEELANELESGDVIVEGIEEQKNLLSQKINKLKNVDNVADIFQFQDSPIDRNKFDLYHFEVEYMGTQIDENTKDSRKATEIPFIADISYRSKTNPDHFIDIKVDLLNGELLHYEQLNGEITPMENVDSVVQAKEIACTEPVKKEELDKLGRTGTEEKKGLRGALEDLEGPLAAVERDDNSATKDVE